MKSAVIPLITICCVNSLALAQIISPDPEEPTICGPKIRSNKVLVLDLESFSGDSAKEQEFIDRYVENLELVSDQSETVRTKTRNTRKKRKHGLEKAQDIAAKKGCNVALVLKAWTSSSGITATVQTTDSIGAGVELRYAFAEVLFGTGKQISKGQ